CLDNYHKKIHREKTAVLSIAAHEIVNPFSNAMALLKLAKESLEQLKIKNTAKSSKIAVEENEAVSHDFYRIYDHVYQRINESDAELCRGLNAFRDLLSFCSLQEEGIQPHVSRVDVHQFFTQNILHNPYFALYPVTIDLDI